MVTLFLSRKGKRVKGKTRPPKMTLHELQTLCGFLNFIGKGIVPGRAFTRRMYAFGKGLTKKYHHLTITRELRLDLATWQVFLNDKQNIFARPFFHYDTNLSSTELDWFTDAAGGIELGMGGVCGIEYFIQQWDETFIKECKPSINYLELLALTVGILSWAKNYKNKSITLFCDNMSVVHMVNNSSSKYQNCMILIRLIVLECLNHNVHINVRHVSGKLNIFPDLLSRMKYSEFKRIAKKEGKTFKFGKPTPIPSVIWPVQKIWLK